MGNISSKSITKAILILSPARALHSIGLDVLLTSIPQIKSALNLSHPETHLIVSIFVLATAISHLFIGPLVDRFGRRPTMLWSIVLFIIGSWIAAISTNIMQLVIARTLQGIGSCGTTIGVLAIFRDIFNENERAKALSYMNGVSALSPMLAPGIGSLLLLYFGAWQANFYFLIIFGLLSFLLCFVHLQETKPVQTLTTNSKSLLLGYWGVLANRKFLSYVIPGISSLTASLLFFSVSSVLVLEILQEPLYKLSLLFASNALVYMGGSFVAPFLLTKWPLYKCVAIGSIIMIAGSVSLLITTYTLPLSLWIIFIPNYLQTFGAGLIFGNASSGALEPFNHNAGLAAATYGFMQYGLASIISASIMMFAIDSMLLPALTILSFGIINIVLMRSQAT